ncbi:unnamed protein product [Lymnaea stagnalis]|uniref:ER membrane protein complex subunit 10 n=1 Tax=Lymnaea stagnalis TaxID=6523 RepID=A0AAV2HEF0_LYMST
MATSIRRLLGLSCLLSVYVGLIAGVMNEDEFEGSRTLVLEHSFSLGSSEFTKRGTLMIQSLKGNKAQFTPGAALSQNDIRLLKQSSKSNGLYRIRIPTKTSGDTPIAFVSSATKACTILESGLEDEITVNFDQSGEVLGVSIRANIPACTGIEMPDANLTTWKTAVEVSTTVAGPMPDTQTYIEKMKRDEQEKLKNQDGDNRTFLGKYWMYIVPVVIMMVIMSSADQQAQGGGGR